SFRSLSTMTASQRNSALAAGTLAVHLCRWIEERFELPPPSIPPLRGFEPETAAQVLRVEWGLGEKPIKNIVHLLEAHGVRVFSLPVDSASVDAFSVWHNGTPFVFLNPRKSAERGRMDAAHELGHLTLHNHGIPRSRQAELEADSFASAFLMPAGDVLAHTPRNVSVAIVQKLKRRWRVSAIAMVHRLKTLRLITEWQYRTFCIELSKQGYRREEKDGIERDSSQVFAKVFDALRAEGVSRSAIARDLKITSTEVDSLLVGLVIASVAGTQNDSQRINQLRPTRETSILKVVEPKESGSKG
ncbi:MAG: ImmA/IrrE family metallo-endopeptidase, partial [Acidobacteriota bacterium]|nr:ImmA/IrrE family metallo-endopeptidase [Acidobacteriota bacterium]